MYLQSKVQEVKAIQMSCIENKKYSNNVYTRDTLKYNVNIDNSQADKFNFDDKKYIILAQINRISITVLYENHPCQDIRKSSLYSLSVPTLTVSTKLLALNVLSIALCTFKNFNNIYTLQNYLSCHALKIKVLK